MSGNPRLPPFPPPTLVQAAGKVYQQLVPGVVGTWAADLGEGLKGGGKGRFSADASAPLAANGALSFGPPRTAADAASSSLFLLSENGELWEYGMELAPKDSPEALIALSLVPAAIWTLQRFARPSFSSHPQTLLLDSQDEIICGFPSPTEQREPAPTGCRSPRTQAPPFCVTACSAPRSVQC